jgi:imidazoleglycerol phosphate dehydratase HisB
MTNSKRIAQIARRTAETNIELSLNLDGTGNCECQTGIGFLDHLLNSLTRHARLDLKLSCKGDLHVDDHHTAEDCALAMGQAIDQTLGERRGIARFGYAYAPLDEALARAVIDFSGRPGAWIDLPLNRDSLGGLSCENIPHVLSSLATAARATLHVDLIRGSNAHHAAEAAFKAVALALRAAVARDGSSEIPSTKGAL